jgi:GNAT superfamily N-acetyltransferase
MKKVLHHKKNQFSISTDKTLLQVEAVHSFLSTKAYWSLGIPVSTLHKAIDGSICFGLYHDTLNGLLQIGFARVVTDYATFAWLCDVYVEEAYRGQGLSKWLVESIRNHPDLQGLRRFCLTTKDAQTLYSQFGFEVTKTPEFWMEIKDNDIYKKVNTDT